MDLLGGRRRGALLVCLLTVLWPTDWCRAVQPQPLVSINVGPGGERWLGGRSALADSNAADRLVDRSGPSEAEPLVGPLSVRIDGLDARLTGVDSRLNTLDSRLDKLTSLVAELAVRTTGGRQAGCGEDRADPRGRTRLPRDCSELPAGAASGVYLLQPGVDRSRPPVAALCDMELDGGNWTVIQRREDVQPRQDFFLGWAAYREGFGELDGEFWWGLENMWSLTDSRDRRYEMRVDLADFDGEQRHANYKQFRVASEADGYRLSVANYYGNAGDSFTFHDGQKFTTKDKDQDEKSDGSCAQKFKGAGWYGNCYRNNLNGRYLSGQTTDHTGVNWNAWRGDNYSLKTAAVRVRPVTVL